MGDPLDIIVSMKIHLNRVSLNQVPFIQYWRCGCGFISQGDISYSSHDVSSHIRESEGVYQCGICDLEDGDKQTIQSHFNSDHLEKLFKCSICGMFYPELFDVVYHTIITHK